MIKLKTMALATIIATMAAATCAQAKTDLAHLPSEAMWQEHANLLGKYWLHPDALGTPVGNFPTWRCNDGTLRNQKACPPETSIPKWGREAMQFDFLRMQSRQTFGYGALYNLTGNPKYLELHQAGVKHILSAMDPEGGFKLLFKDGKPVNEPRLTRTTQDLPYAIIGLAMNAYLTHDPKIIDVIMKTQKYIYDTYYDEKEGLLRWVLEDFAPLNNRKEQLELVAELDQMNAYLILCWRLVPEAKTQEWSNVIKRTVDIINAKFYDKKHNRFQGCIDNESCYDEATGRHMDYGHSCKAFWMEYLAACGLDDPKLKAFAEKGMLETLNKAFDAENQSWYENVTHAPASWWVYAELDQAALTLALEGKYDMPKTLFTWINDRTDKEYGEILSRMKTNLWRSAFHSTEHALIGSIVSNGIRYAQCNDDACRNQNKSVLYFAPFDPKVTDFTPYIYSGKIESIKAKGDGVKVTFKEIAPPKKVK